MSFRIFKFVPLKYFSSKQFLRQSFPFKKLYAFFFFFLEYSETYADRNLSEIGEKLNFSSEYFVKKYFQQGMAWVNGFMLGRYWPRAGPQVTLYVPHGLLRKGGNMLMLLELQRSPCVEDRRVRIHVDLN